MRWSQTINNYAQVIALIIAGIWAYSVFIQKEAPSLEPRASTDSTLTWTRVRNSEDCEAQFWVHLANVGAVSFDVNQVTIKGWRFKRQASTEFATYLDLDTVQLEENRVISETYPAGNGKSEEKTRLFMIGHYPPSQEYSNTLSWIIHSDPEYWVLFHAQFYGNKGKYSWITYQWSAVDCSNDSASQARKSEPLPINQ